MPPSWYCRDHTWPNQPLHATAKKMPRLTGTTLSPIERVHTASLRTRSLATRADG